MFSRSIDLKIIRSWKLLKVILDNGFKQIIIFVCVCVFVSCYLCIPNFAISVSLLDLYSYQNLIPIC